MRVYFHVVGTCLEVMGGMGVARHTMTSMSREAAARERALSAPNDPKPCAVCGEITRGRTMCTECLERARPYQADDPYDDLGGEN